MYVNLLFLSYCFFFFSLVLLLLFSSLFLAFLFVDILFLFSLCTSLTTKNFQNCCHCANEKVSSFALNHAAAADRTVRYTLSFLVLLFFRCVFLSFFGHLSFPSNLHITIVTRMRYSLQASNNNFCAMKIPTKPKLDPFSPLFFFV